MANDSQDVKERKIIGVHAWLRKCLIDYEVQGSHTFHIKGPEGELLFIYDGLTQHWSCFIGGIKTTGNFFLIMREEVLLYYLNYYKNKSSKLQEK